MLAVLPLAAGLLFSLSSGLGIIGTFSHEGTLDHFGKVFTSFEFIRSVLYSYYIATSVMIISTTIAILVAIRLSEQRLTRSFERLIHLPLALPTVVAAYLIFHTLSATGILSRIGYKLHMFHEINQFPNLINDVAGLGIIITHTLLAVPFLVLLFVNLYRQHLLHELYIVSRELGSDRSYFRKKVAIPVLLRTSRPSLILYFIFILGIYEAPLLLGNEKWQMMSMLVATKLRRFDLTDLPYAYALVSVFAILTIGMVILGFQKKNQL